MSHCKHHFSLLELVICLGILAVLASLVLENFADVKARESESQTTERGTRVREAVLGSRTGEGFGRFLSDMGRFPSLYIPAEGDGSGGRRLAELYDPAIWYSGESGSTLHRIHTISAADIGQICRTPSGATFPAEGSGIHLPYPSVSMSAGWNGPYLQIASPVKGNFRDGWGHPWRIVTNYNLHLSGNRLEENTAGTNPVKIYGSSGEINALRNVSANRRTRMDGIASFGANNADDSGSAETAAADADQRFLFAHNMDNCNPANLADLTVTLKLRDQAGNQWLTLPAMAPWKAGTAYAPGEIVFHNGARYCCTTAHTAGSAFSGTNWADVASAAPYDPTTHGTAAAGMLCIYRNVYYIRSNDTGETAFTAANWKRIAAVGELPDSISLLLFTPVMQGGYDSRVMQLGYFHFFRNAAGSNAHGVKPLYGAASPAEDIDCEGSTDIVYTEDDDYNARYLIAEDHSGDGWHEFRIRRLIPGQRKIFCVIYNCQTRSCYQTQVEVLPLKPGENHISLYLERKL